MEIKIDTKEKFFVLTPPVADFSDIIACSLRDEAEKIFHSPIKNIIVNFENVQTANAEQLHLLASLHKKFYTAEASFVVCCIQPEIKKQLLTTELWHTLNITPTESEAWDMVQMEEMEREMFGDDDE